MKEINDKQINKGITTNSKYLSGSPKKERERVEINKTKIGPTINHFDHKSKGVIKNIEYKQGSIKGLSVKILKGEFLKSIMMYFLELSKENNSK